MFPPLPKITTAYYSSTKIQNATIPVNAKKDSLQIKISQTLT